MNKKLRTGKSVPARAFSAIVGLILATSFSAVADEGFAPLGSVTDMPAATQARASAVFKFSDRSSFNSCTASFISDDGYALTALHCLQSCLTSAGLMKSRETEGLRIWTTSTQVPTGLKCELFVSGETENAFPKVDVVFVGRTYFQGNAAAVHQKNPMIYANLLGNYGDFAIVKFSKPKSSCIPARLDVPAAGERLWSLGFPAATQRWFNNSDGESLSVSRGRVYSREESIRAAANATMWLHDILWQNMTGGLEQKVSTDMSCSSGRCLFSDIDLVRGNSGSPAVDDFGALVGVNVASYSTIDTYRPLGVTIPTVEIRRQISVTLGAAAAEKMFSCL